MTSAPSASTDARDLWDDLFPLRPHEKPPADPLMLRLIAYDIADPKRLAHMAEACEDYGVRVQKSLFECWLEPDAFERLWVRLTEIMDASEDGLLAYTLDQSSVPRRRKAGEKTVLTQPRELYLL